jgi:thiol:disulfide interchange protein/DsbC/DsbD-like thiol-disulfide interchange protein
MDGTMRNKILTVLVLCVLAWQRAVVAQEYEGRQLVEARLLADTESVVPGQAFEVGVLLEMAPGWHTYWEYSGDSGLPTKVEWSLPPGYEAGPLRWPAPVAKVEPGDIRVYGYSGRVLLMSTITPPTDARGTAALKADVTWLVCEEICIPGEASLELDLPVGAQAAPANTRIFEEFRALLPSASPPPFDVRWSRKGGVLRLEVDNPVPEGRLELFPLPAAGQLVGHPEPVAPGVIEIPVEGAFRGVLAVGEGAERRAWTVTDEAGAADAAAPAMGLWQALVYGFLGGLILNLMPCVLPVISLKIFGFIKQAGDSRTGILMHGLAFMGGIFTWFLGLAVVVVALKSSGAEVTWAFQFQNPWFNVVIGAIVFVFALNLAGVFELVLPGKASTAMESAGSGTGLGGSFFQGLFATLLATPCTAPFLGSALGFAFSQGAGVVFAMFGSVAGGMAMPYLLLSARPGWMRFLPRPGAWMERLKQFMAFPLFATLVWILSIIGGQQGVDGIIRFSGFLVCLGLGAWIYGAFCGPLASIRRRSIALLMVVVVSGGGGWYFLGGQPAAGRNGEVIDWVEFSESRLRAEVEAGRNVFVDFTADWCITCKFNERTAIDTPAVRRMLVERGVVAMKADWTNADPGITAALKAFGRVGVPFYVLYPAGDEANPVVLPELLTESIMLEALRNLP